MERGGSGGPAASHGKGYVDYCVTWGGRGRAGGKRGGGEASSKVVLEGHGGEIMMRVRLHATRITARGARGRVSGGGIVRVVWNYRSEQGGLLLLHAFRVLTASLN